MTFSRIAFITLALSSTSLHATTYTLEPNYTQVVVHWDHLGFSSPSAQFGQGTGTLDFDPSDLAKASVKVTLPLASLNTSVPDLDEHLRSADFFETAKFPAASFSSSGRNDCRFGSPIPPAIASSRTARPYGSICRAVRRVRS